MLVGLWRAPFQIEGLEKVSFSSNGSSRFFFFFFFFFFNRAQG